ncbi:MAG TPA: adenylate/guanylate cyclase domain-containing protein [Rectinemataceae bacterium]|nr:adenylate/guanylate cyclase domain-containing protein [Rectinemataceae bacterium]
MEQKDYRLAAIMYTDIAGFSRMMERDETGTLELLKFHNDLIGGIVAKRHGTVIKTIGDALLVDFRNTVEALQTALEVQDSIYAHNQTSGKLPLLVRIGLHLGDIYFFENDALGEGINIAARLQSLARPGCICFSQDVYNQVLNKIEFRADKLGKVSLKNITKEIHAFEITTPNVEFDPDRDKPRPGYKPGIWLEGESSVASTDVSGSRESPAWASALHERRAEPEAQPIMAKPISASAPAGKRIESEAGSRTATMLENERRFPPEAPAMPPPPPGPMAAREPSADRSYSEEGSRSLLTEIRKAILEDIKKEGRRLTVEETRERYGFYGVEAQEVIAEMAEQGLLVRTRGPSGGDRSQPRDGEAASGHGRAASTDIGKTIEAAVHGIVTEIEKSVERSVASGNVPDFMKSKMERLNDKLAGKGDRIQERIARKSERLQERMERHAYRHEYRHGRRDGESFESGTGRWEKGLDEDENWRDSNGGAEGVQGGAFARYRDSLVSKASRSASGFFGHLASYLGVNGFLWYLNLTSSAGFHWAAIVSAAWGIGLASNAAAVIRGGIKARQVEALPDLDNEQLKLYRSINRSNDGMVQHLVSNVMVTLLLAQINLMTDAHFLWFLIPTGALAISVISHLGAWLASKPRLERRFRESLGISGDWRKATRASATEGNAGAELGDYGPLWREAERTKAAILAENAGHDAAGDDLGPVLENYVAQVRLLAASARDIDRIVDSIPMAELGRDKAALLTKEAAASGPNLRAEYRKNIDEIEKQERSYAELSEQREVIKLRLSSSVNQLKQMRMDIARVRAAGQGEAAAGAASEGFGTLKSRTEELTHYLKDLRKGYDESRKDPFAELEAAEREKNRLGAADGETETR